VGWCPESQLSDEKLDELQSAILHHVIIYSVRRASSGKTSALANKLGIAESRLGQLLRGDVNLQLEHIANFRRNLSISLARVEEMVSSVDEVRVSDEDRHRSSSRPSSRPPGS
jgi:transcriptional regulator with XRE-family HTH domain